GTAHLREFATLTVVPSRPPKKRHRLRDSTVLLALLAAIGYIAYHFATQGPAEAGCTVAAGGDTLRLTPEQAANAATIAAAAAAHEGGAAQLPAALRGRGGAGLGCTTGADRAGSAGGPAGDTAQVTARLTHEVGKRVRARADAAPRTVAAAPGGAPGRGWQVA